MTRLVAGGFVVIVLIETLAFVIEPRISLPAAGLALAGFVLLAAGRLGGGAGGPAGPADSGAGESLRRWRSQTEALIAWADGTRGDWDRHLRPRLAREFMLATGHKESGSGEQAASREQTGRMVFGDELWAWVDPSAVRRAGRDEPGPGAAGLAEILRRLEQI